MMNAIERFADAIEFLRRQLNKDLPSQHIALLVAVARQPGITMPDLGKRLDMPQGTVSRNVKLMSHFYDSTGRDAKLRGYGLLETSQAPDNRYQLAVHLTPDGKRLVDALSRILAHGAAAGSTGQDREHQVIPLHEEAC